MRVLFITATLPHARVYSGSIIVHQRIKLLAERGYQVGLASFVEPAAVGLVQELRPMLCELEVLPVPPPMSKLRAGLAAVAGAVPPPVCFYTDPAMARLVGRMVEQSHYDVAIAEFTAMGQYLFRNVHLPAVRRIISVHSCVTCAYQKALQMDSWSKSAIRRRIILHGLRHYEFEMYRSADLLLTVTNEERQEILRHEPDLRIAAIPYGVDTERFRPGPDQGSEESLVFTGYYRDEPNLDAVLWFCRSVWPTIRARHPALKFYVVGAGAPRDLYDLARRDPHIIVTGEVPDVAPYLSRSRIFVCPTRMGAGFQGKILQAMAAGVPVVATSRSAEGIPADPGNNIMLADTPHIMAENISLLLDDEELRQRLSEQARLLVERRFAWSRCVDLLEAAIRESLR